MGCTMAAGQLRKTEEQAAATDLRRTSVVFMCSWAAEQLNSHSLAEVAVADAEERFAGDGRGGGGGNDVGVLRQVWPPVGDGRGGITIIEQGKSVSQKA